MRPVIDVPESNQYECPGCGARATAPDSRYCEGCDRSMRALDNGRDL